MGERHEDTLSRLGRAGAVGAPPVAAASVIPIRNGEAGLEVLMLRRNSKIAFGGMWVFPGGRVASEDLRAGDDELSAARRAAVREAVEESGLKFEHESLVPYSHWTPPTTVPKRFLTWFFIAAAPKADVVIDNQEIHEHSWMRPDDALRRRDTGEIELAPPTFVTLFELRAWPSVGAAIDHAERRAPEHFVTRIVVSARGPSALWQGDSAYENGNLDALGARHRLDMHAEGWRYVRTGRVD